MKSLSKIVTLLCVTSLLWCSNAWALTLQQAKSSGWVGEQTNGYLGIVIDTQEVQALVLSVNAKRKTQSTLSSDCAA